MLTMNCDGHPLLSRLHKPDPTLPADAQDKRAAIPIAAEHWEAWLGAPLTEAHELLRLPPAELFDPTASSETDQLLARLRQQRPPEQGSLIWLNPVRP
jgi:hypothetical protein